VGGQASELTFPRALGGRRSGRRAEGLVRDGAKVPVFFAVQMSLMVDSVEKVGVLTRPNFFAPWVRFSDSDAGGLIIHLRLNGASSKSICGGNKRQSKMSLVF